MNMLSIVKSCLLQSEVSSCLKFIRPSVESTNIEDVYSRILNQEPDLSVRAVPLI